jgi:hypothetical protein
VSTFVRANARALKRVHRRAQKLTVAPCGPDRAEAGVDHDPAAVPDDRPDEKVERHRSVVSLEMEEVLGGLALQEGRVAQGQDLVFRKTHRARFPEMA